MRLLQIGINPDHVHLVFSAKPIHYLPEIMKEIKGNSSRLTNKNGEDFIKWQRGYDIRTVSEWNLQKTIEYVKNQDQHHQNKWD